MSAKEKLIVNNFDFEKYIECVIETAQSRIAHHRSFNEIEFFVGAMVLFKFLNRMDKVPACWIFGPIVGKDILEYYTKEKGE